MCKIVFLTVLFCSWQLGAACGTFHYGAKTGVTFASQDFDYTEFGSPDFDTRIGLGLVVFGEWPILPALSVVAELQYVPKGHKISFQVPDYSRIPNSRLLSVTARVDYISLPLLLRVSVPEGRARTYLFAGPRFDIKVGHAESMGFEVLYRDFKPTIWGGSIGVGQTLPVSTGIAALIEFHYHYDFDEAYRTHLLVVKNTAWAILVGVEL
ncbi:MAG: porin family protein [bacterium]